MAEPARLFADEPRAATQDSEACAAPDRPFPTARGVLSAEEIEALLRPDLPEDVPSPPVVSAADTPSEALPLLPIEDALADAADIAARLSLALRTDCQLDARLRALAGRRGRLSDMDLPMASTVCVFANGERQIVAALAVENAPLRTMVLDACGDGAPPSGEDKPLSTLETAIAFRLLEPLASIFGADTRLIRLETDGENARALLAPIPGTEARFRAVLCGVEGEASLAWQVPDMPERVPGSPCESTAAGTLSTALTARIASLSVPVSRLANLKPGATLLLGLPADQPVELLSGGRKGEPVAEGRIGRKGTRMALKITARRAL